MRPLHLAVAVTLACAAAGCTLADPDVRSAAQAGAVRAIVAEAVAAPGRPAEARALDESRKPAEVLEWLGVQPGMEVADVITGTGYWAEIIDRVVGPHGAVVALQPEQFYTGAEDRAKLAEMLARAPRVSIARYPFEAFAYPADSFDAALINLSYHDLYWQSEQYKIPRSDPDLFVRGLYTAMRPGGVVGVIDHVGPAGDTRAVVDKLHRIDPAVVRADFERAGFVLVDESDLLANPGDDHAKLVFDPAVRGKTDRFMMKFRKPGT